MTIPQDKKRTLYSYLNTIARNKGCEILRINGIGNHIHILLRLSPTMALSSFVKELKRCSSMWLNGNPDFPNFESWGKEYFAMSINPSIIENVSRYIDGQETHHAHRRFEDELKEMCIKMGFDWRDNLLSND